MTETTQQHTPEPWRVGIPGTVVSDSSEGITIRGGTGEEAVNFYGGNLICESVSVINAARIVECVNACKGIKHPSEWITRARDLVRSEEELKFKVSELTDKLNEATNAAVQWKNDYEALQSQRDELINALKEVLRNPVRIVKAAVAYFISKSHPVTDSVAKDAEWYANIVKHIEPAEAEKGANNG